jgi:D-alanyl-D-alanine carboxypeptidase
MRDFWELIALVALGCASRAAASDQPPPRSRVDAAAAKPAPRTVRPSAPGPILVDGRRCREQSAQPFLLRQGQLAKPGATWAEQRQIAAARIRSIAYRTREYGYFHGFGSPGDNSHSPRYYAETTKFMGVPVVVNRKIVPALECVQAALLRDCAAHPYQPEHLSGLRLHNTYKDYEISNHVYGIAIDVDPARNPCCHCVGHWAKQAICRKHFASVYDEMAMPRCWVKVFERYGFYWLGHDELGDTMHFEFLGDPERILE